MHETMRRLYLAAKEMKGIQTKSELARALNESPQVLKNWENRGISKAGMVKADAAIGCSLGWLSTGAGSMEKSVTQKWKTGNLTITNNVDVPLMNVHASMGPGTELPETEIAIDYLRLKKTWAEKTLGKISNITKLAFIHAIGDSMSPTINAGDILLVDTGNKQVLSDQIYVMEAHGRLFIKRIRQRIDGSFEVSSDNPLVKTVDTLNGDHEVTVKGHVVWIWNGKRV